MRPIFYTSDGSDETYVDDQHCGNCRFWGADMDTGKMKCKNGRSEKNTRRRRLIAGAGVGSKTGGGQTAGKDRVMTMHMTMIMLTDRRARRASASVLLAVYSAMLITGIAVMFRLDSP